MAIRKIVSRSIGTDVIAAEDLAANSVTVAEITDGAVTSAKMNGLTGSSSGIIQADGDGSLSTTTADLVDDTTPQLGGDLDAQSNDITNISTADFDSPASTVHAIQIGDSHPHASTAKAHISIYDTSRDPSIHLRGLSPKIYFDRTSGGQAEILTDDGDFVIKKGSIDTEGDGQLKLDNSGYLYTDSGYGSLEKSYGVRAWLYYNGDTATIRDSENISSVTYNGNGDYTINFSITFPDTNYILLCESFDGGGQNDFREINSSFTSPGKTTTQHRIYAYGATSGSWSPALDNTSHLMVIAVR